MLDAFRRLAVAVLALLPMAASSPLINTLLPAGGGGVTTAVAALLKLLGVTLPLTLLFATTEPPDLLNDLEDRGLGRRTVFVLGAALAAVPRAQARAVEVIEAQRARGLDTEGSWRWRTRGVLPLVTPLVIGSLAEVEDRALALEVRAFGAPGRRTVLYPLPDSGQQRLGRWAMAAGLAPVTIGGRLGGRVLVDGQPTVELAAHQVAQRCGVLFDNPAVQLTGLHRTVYEEVAFGPCNLGLAEAEVHGRTRAALRLLDLEHLRAQSWAPVRWRDSLIALALAGLLALRRETVAVMGPTGSGKSILIRHLNGLLRRTAGRVLLAGKDVRGLRVAQLARRVGIAFQEPDRQLFCRSVRADRVRRRLGGRCRRRVGPDRAA